MPSMIAAAAVAGGAATETYGGATIIEDPKNTHGVAFLSATMVVAGDLAGVKAAIDRQTTPAPLSAAIIIQVNQWSWFPGCLGHLHRAAFLLAAPGQRSESSRHERAGAVPDDSVGGRRREVRRLGGDYGAGASPTTPRTRPPWAMP